MIQSLDIRTSHWQLTHDLTPLTVSDKHLISPYIITPESHIKVTRIKEMITNEEALDCDTNSPYVENSVENMHTNVGVWRVK